MLDSQINPSSESSAEAILQRLAGGDKTALKDCIKVYANTIWNLAKQYTDSIQEAEVATEEIFLDIWKYCGKCESNNYNEKEFIVLLARRRLIKRAREKK